MINIEHLEEKLIEVSSKLELLTEKRKVLRTIELENILKKELSIKGSDLIMIIYFLSFYQFIRKVKKQKNCFFIIGKKRSEQIEEFEINLLIMNLGMTRIMLRKTSLEQEIKNNLKEISKEQNKNKQKKIKMESIAKSKVCLLYTSPSPRD